jgi:hypothetical protein
LCFGEKKFKKKRFHEIQFAVLRKAGIAVVEVLIKLLISKLLLISCLPKEILNRWRGTQIISFALFLRMR